MTGLEGIIEYLPERFAYAASRLPGAVAARAEEVRLRLHGAASVTAGADNFAFDGGGRLCPPDSAIKATEKELAECLALLSGGSLYACEESLAKGYIPIKGAGRAGVCGRAVTEKGEITGFSEISSVDLRIHRFIKDCAAPLVALFAKEGVKSTLVIAPPGRGKTTFLRSVAWMAANGAGIAPHRVAIADEREEICVSLPPGGFTDILRGAPKAEAMEILTRSLSPQIIVCDEISGRECRAVAEAQNCGAAVISSAHGKSPEDVIKRPGMKELIGSGAFEYAVTINDRAAPEITRL